MRPAWLEIDLKAIANNITAIKKLVGNRKIMAVVKADAYGHGAFQISEKVLKGNIDYLCVAILDEALKLKLKGIKVPTLILGFTPNKQADQVIQNQFRQTIYTWEQAKHFSSVARELSQKVYYHIKIDTGMGRLGFLPSKENAAVIQNICNLPNVVVEGIYTHFATADEDDLSFSLLQWNLFEAYLKDLGKDGITIPLIHAANSAAVLRCPFAYAQAVRPGLLLYGVNPLNSCLDGVQLKPAMELKATISFTKKVKAGVGLSYGLTHVTPGPRIIATVPLGYADGLKRAFSNKASVIIHGQKAPIVGRICMDQCLIDVTNIHREVKMGDTVTLLGCDGDEKIFIDEWADLNNTISYEILTGFSSRLPRIYKNR